MSVPVSIHDGPFSTNTLASKKFLIIYFILTWLSLIPVIFEFILFWKILDFSFLLFMLLLPVQLLLSYIILLFSAIGISKVFYILVNKKYPPKEGSFQRSKADLAYYYWSLRGIIKKWPIWVANLLPLHFINDLLLKWFDKELLEIGNNVIIGQGCYIRPCMILQDNLIIKKVIIGNNVVIGANSYISPGTHIGNNTIIEALSITKIDQILKPNSRYDGQPAKSFEELIEHLQEQNIPPKKNKNIQDKFSRKTSINLINIYLIHTCSYIIPIYVGIFYFFNFFYPIMLENALIIEIFLNLNVFLFLLLTPLVIISLYFVHLLIIIITSKFFYIYIKYKCPPREDVFHWDNKSKEYEYYFIRSFLLRYLKWKIQRSPYPWLLKPTYNYMGNCQIGKATVIEDVYSAKEFLHIGKNSHIGNSLIANHLWDKNLTIKGINIEDNVVISDGCSISPGTEIKSNTTILPLSITKKFSILQSDSLYYGTPIRKLNSLEELNNTLKTSTNDTLISTNNIYENIFLWIFPILIWFSFLPTFCVFLFSYKFFFDLITPLGVILILPFVVIFYFGLFIVCLLFISKLFLVLFNLIHKLKEGTFNIDKKDKDYYFFFLRKTIKTFVFRLINLFPIPWIKLFGFRLFDNNISYSCGLLDSYIDSDFIEIGENTILGEGTIVMSSMILGDSLILKKITLRDGCTIGAYSVIAPGTTIGSNTILGMGSCTKVNQKLEDGWVYVGKPAKKWKENQ